MATKDWMFAYDEQENKVEHKLPSEQLLPVPVVFPGFQTWSSPQLPLTQFEGLHPPLHPMSVDRYQVQREQVLASPSKQPALSEQTWAARAIRLNTEYMSSGSPNPSVRVPQNPASFPAPLATLPPLPRRSHSRMYVVAILALLVILVVISSLIGQRLLIGNNQVSGPLGHMPIHVTSQDPSSHMDDKQLASLYVSHMSLDEEIGQVMMVSYGDALYSQNLATMVHTLHAGGVIMYEFQMQTADQTKQGIAQMQQHATSPLFISTDEEGGLVHRLLNIDPPRMSAMDIYNSGDVNVAASQGHRVAHDLLALGINENLAPDVDIASENDVNQQMQRTFGFTANSVIKFAGPYMQAMQQDGIIGGIKHFPGLDDATMDGEAQPLVTRSKDQIYSVDLAPFKYFVQSPNKLLRPGMVMATNVLVPAIDPVMPAELSHAFITDILRKQFGYDGVVLTDVLFANNLEVGGKHISMPQAGIMALNAGDDMLMGPANSDQMLQMVDAIKAALSNGTLSKTRLDEAATRIITLKMQRGLMPAQAPHV